MSASASSSSSGGPPPPPYRHAPRRMRRVVVRRRVAKRTAQPTLIERTPAPSKRCTGVQIRADAGFGLLKPETFVVLELSAVGLDGSERALLEPVRGSTAGTVNPVWPDVSMRFTRFPVADAAVLFARVTVWAPGLLWDSPCGTATIALDPRGENSGSFARWVRLGPAHTGKADTRLGAVRLVVDFVA
eukprot:Amastigsp_a677414_6.p2 type:complete len:188 gc:universal Amastigsp_a677414_6:935-372(-)